MRSDKYVVMFSMRQTRFSNRKKDYDADNIRSAKIILADPAKYGAFMVQWARKVLARTQEK